MTCFGGIPAKLVLKKTENPLFLFFGISICVLSYVGKQVLINSLTTPPLVNKAELMSDFLTQSICKMTSRLKNANLLKKAPQPHFAPIFFFLFFFSMNLRYSPIRGFYLWLELNANLRMCRVMMFHRLTNWKQIFANASTELSSRCYAYL